MTKEAELVRIMREVAASSTATETAKILYKYSERPIDQFDFVRAFKLAFPEIPIPVLKEASLWVCPPGEGMSNEELNHLLAEWLGPS